MEDEEFKVVDLQYWKEIKDKLGSSLFDVSNILFISNEEGFEELVHFLNSLAKSGTILYISLTKTFSTIKSHIDKCKANVIVVDCVTLQLLDKAPSEDCRFHATPKDLSELETLIAKVAHEVNHSFLVVDSLSTYVDFSSGSETGRSFSDFLKVIKDLNSECTSKGVLMYNSSVSQTLSLPKFVFDTIIKMDIIKEKVSWR